MRLDSSDKHDSNLTQTTTIFDQIIIDVQSNLKKKKNTSTVMMNNLHDEDYRKMLKYFRLNDLRALLKAFGRNSEGKRTELRERALELLNFRPDKLNYAAYLSKIYDIYHLLPCHPSGFSNDNMMHSSMQTQQRPQQRQMMTINQIPQQRMYRPPQYQQSMYMPQARMPHLMKKMEGGVYGNPTGANTIPENTISNSDIQYGCGSYQPVRPRIIVPSPRPSQMPSNQQNMSSMIQNTLGFVFNASTGRNNNALIPSPQIVANYKFKNLPFYDVIDDIIKPTLLSSLGTKYITLLNPAPGMKECRFEHTMSAKQATLISMNRDISPGKPEYYGIQYQIRICQLENDVYDEVTDCLPIALDIRVCNYHCTLPPIVTPELSRMESRRAARPINITQYLKLCPFVINSININWFPGGKKYAYALYMVKQLSVDTLMQKLHDKKARSSEETKNYIIKKLTNVDPDLTTTSSYNFSLVCPLSKVRMKIPAKSIHCDHIQCFDAGTFISMNEKKPRWMCPTCDKSCLYDDLQIENYFLEIITSPTLSDDINVIEVLADGSWIIPKGKKDTKKIKPIDYIDLDNTDDDVVDEKCIESKEEPRPGGSECQKSENLKPHLVNMYEDEEPSKQKDKL